MSSEKPPEEDAQDPQQHKTLSIHVYPPTQPHPPSIQSKRHQVKNACTNCQKVCKKCDDSRPCLRCVKYGIEDNCVSSQRKTRQSVKRGPYKRKRKDGDIKQDEPKEPIQMVFAASAIQSPYAEPANIPNSCPPFGYPPGCYMCNQYLPIPPENLHFCTSVAHPYFLASCPNLQPYLHAPESHLYQAYYTTALSYHPTNDHVS